MTRKLALLLSCAVAPTIAFAACSSGREPASTTATTGAMGGSPDAGDAAPSVCEALGLTSRPLVTTGTGKDRGSVAGDFTLSLLDGTSWTYSAEATGCETYVFIPDILTVSQVNDESVWDHDLPTLLSTSPKNVHYFFVSLLETAAEAAASTKAMQARVDALVSPAEGGADGGLDAADQAWWKTHLHVVSGQGQKIAGWVGEVLSGWGEVGFAIDRRQLLRGVGTLSDVTRQDPSIPSGDWPFDSNLTYAAYEPIYMNAESDELDRLDAENATVVPVLTGSVIAGDGYADVSLPSDLSAFDTLEVEVNMACPDPTAIEFNSCGAWDYIAQLFLDTPQTDAGVAEAGADDAGDAGVPVVETELARFITSYHRETHWVEDITPMLALLSGPGPVRLHYSYAPSWNLQPTAVTLSLRLSNQKKGYVPATLTPIATGGTWDDQYNVGRVPVSAPIPADTKHAEVWMIVTGHGSDAQNCGEFCDTTHQFTLDGAANTWSVSFPMAGTETGCMPEDTKGMVPNQGGTWWYGRDGWCPGQQVTPHVWDVTSLATPGSTATVTYEGLFNGGMPPSGGSGNIVLTSYLVTFH